MKNYALVFVVTSILFLIACRSPLEWTGNLKGTYELMDEKDATSSAFPRPAPLETGRGSARLYTGRKDHIRLGADTPIPDCTFEVEKHSAIGETQIEYKINNSEKAHTGETDDGKGCIGRISKDGPLVSVEIENCSVSLNRDGEIVVSIDYLPINHRPKQTLDPLAVSTLDRTKQRVLYLKGERGWF